MATTKDPDLYNPNEAVRYATRACKIAEVNQQGFWDTLAVAYAAAGNFPEAIKTAQKAVELADVAGEKELADGIRQRLELYKSGQPYRPK